jgi:D-glycero-beta-D-manno-heptose-7-phosphate kinase
LDSADVLALIDELPGHRVAVIGDAIADEFVYGRVARVSREAPVLILEYDSTEVVAGGAGNAANNVAAMGGSALLAAVVGRDEPARRLLKSLHRRVNPRTVIRTPRRGTTIKTRILAGGIHSAKQQVVRIDRVANGAIDKPTRDAFFRAAMSAAMRADAVLLSDYGGGLVSPAVVSRLRRELKRSRRSGFASTTMHVCWRGREGRFSSRRRCRRCSLRVEAAGWRCSFPESRRFTFRSSGRMKLPTSPAQATR